jgi:hypothetical protein
MGKKKFNLSTDMIVKDSGQDESVKEHNNSIEDYTTITLRIKTTVKKEFNLWCVQNGLKMNDAFVEAWQLLRDNYK